MEKVASGDCNRKRHAQSEAESFQPPVQNLSSSGLPKVLEDVSRAYLGRKAFVVLIEISIQEQFHHTHPYDETFSLIAPAIFATETRNLWKTGRNLY